MLTIRLVSIDGRRVPMPEERRLDNGSLTIGRGADSSWQVQDESRNLSKQHCLIRSGRNGYELVDTSTNGVFHNDAAKPLGRDATVILADGDRLRMGRYVFEVSLGGGEAALSRFSALWDSPAPPSFSGPAAFSQPTWGDDPAPARPGPPPTSDPLGPATPWDDPPAAPAWGVRADGPQALPGWGGGDDEEEDLLGAPRAAGWRGGDAGLERRPSPEDAFRAPGVVEPSPFPAPDGRPGDDLGAGLIPDDWDIDETVPDSPSPMAFPPRQTDDPPGGVRPEETAAPRPAAVPGATVVRPLRQPPPPEPRNAAPPPAGGPDADRLLAAFLDGAGLGDMDRSALDAEEVMRRAGAVLREAVGGLAAMMDARHRARGELRVQRTMLSPTRTNPLKVSLPRDEILARVLEPPAKGYAPGPEAVREAVRDIRAHEMALLAGVQIALKGLVAKFDPDWLKGRLESSSSFVGIIPAMRKARYWEIYELMHASIARDVEEEFQRAYAAAVEDEYEARLDHRDEDGS